MQINIGVKRRLVQLNKGNAVRIEGRYNDSVGQIDFMKQLSAVVVEDHVVNVDMVTKEIEAGPARAVQECRKDYGINVKEVNNRFT